MKETTKIKIKYVTRQMLAIRLLERKAEDKKEQLEKWLETNSVEISEYVQSLQAASIKKFHQVNNDYIAELMLKDGLPYFYISNLTNLPHSRLYIIKNKLGKLVNKNG